MASFSCPHCGEPIDTFPDPGGPPRQEYIEDCSVCCRPVLISAILDAETDEFFVEASPEV